MLSLLGDHDLLLRSECRIVINSVHFLADPDLEPVGPALLETAQQTGSRIRAEDDFGLRAVHSFIVSVEQHIAVSVRALLIGRKHLAGLSIFHILPGDRLEAVHDLGV